MIRCPLCKKTKGGTCTYHALKTPQELFGALAKDLEKRGAQGLVRMVLAGQSTLVNLPDDVLDALSEDTEKLTQQFAKVLEKETFGRDDLLLLAALSLVLAALHGDDEDAPEPTAHAETPTEATK